MAFIPAGIALQAANEYTSDAKTIFLWHLDGDLKDSGLNHLDAQNGESNVKLGVDSVPGLKTGATEFLGSRYLKADPSPALMSFAKELTFEMWIKDPLSGSGSGPDIGIIGQYRTSSSIQWILCIRNEDKAMDFSITIDSLSKARESLRTKPLVWEKGKWHHIAVVVAFNPPDITDLKIYRSEEGISKTSLIASKTFKGDIEKGKMAEVLNEGDIRIGGAGFGARFLGSECCIDEIRYSNAARSEYDFDEHVGKSSDNDKNKGKE
jgi:hypothetical protein